MNNDHLTHLILVYSYAGIFTWFVFFDQLIPLPEEAALLSIGYLAAQVPLNIFFCMLSSVVALLLIDNFYYYLTKRGSRLTERMKKKLGEHTRAKTQAYMNRNSTWTLFGLALLPRIRFFAPMLAAGFNVSWKKFAIVNSAATVLYVLVYTLLGYVFHNRLDKLMHETELLRHIVFIVAVIVIVGVASFVVTKKLMRNGKKV
ncbi:MAG TPA: VTT domain-containing protein [Bacteroidia bacterium]|nr:VTT domain-containing protein [Bacteroidia bacterium]